MASIKKYPEKTAEEQKYIVYVCVNGTRAVKVIYAKNDEDTRRQVALIEKKMGQTATTLEQMILHSLSHM